jgi:hypothetical protein
MITKKRLRTSDLALEGSRYHLAKHTLFAEAVTKHPRFQDRVLDPNLSRGGVKESAVYLPPPERMFYRFLQVHCSVRCSYTQLTMQSGKEREPV